MQVSTDPPQHCAQEPVLLLKARTTLCQVEPLASSLQLLELLEVGKVHFWVKSPLPLDPHAFVEYLLINPD